MASKKGTRGIPASMLRIIMLIIGCVVSAVVLTLSALTIITVSQGNYQDAPKYLIWIFLAMAVASFITYMKNKTKTNLIRCIVLAVFNVALGVLVLFAKNTPYMFSLTAGLYCIVVIISCVFRIIEKPKVRTIVLNAIIMVLALQLAIGLFMPVEASQINNVILIECMFIAITALAEVATVAFGQLKFQVLFKIIVNTFALEVLFGLVAIMIASALVLMSVEPSFTTFGDSLWYCFIVVTTIGFGDLVAETLIGRLISVILGMYGIVAVAVITSIIVNFYNETSGKKDAKEIKNIQKEEDIK